MIDKKDYIYFDVNRLHLNRKCTYCNAISSHDREAYSTKYEICDECGTLTNETIFDGKERSYIERVLKQAHAAMFVMNPENEEDPAKAGSLAAQLDDYMGSFEAYNRDDRTDMIVADLVTLLQQHDQQARVVLFDVTSNETGTVDPVSVETVRDLLEVKNDEGANWEALDFVAISFVGKE